MRRCSFTGRNMVFICKIPVLSTFPPTIRNMGIYSEDLYTIRHSALFYFCIG